jgi:2-amino-4-hydroxy-6-hydroxymethyldihydropteridine diphosphokinase
MARAFVGLGGNLGGEGTIAARFDRALEEIERWPGAQVARVSSLWRTAPLGPVHEQPQFLNAVAQIDVHDDAAPRALLAQLLAVEAMLGRDRSAGVAQGARSIDLDLLLWGSVVMDDPGPPRLVLPHPRLHARAFALAPLCEIAGEDLVIPGVLGGRAGDLLAAALRDPAQPIEKM